MPDTRFSPGFRLSLPDCVILLSGIGGAMYIGRFDLSIALLVAMPVLHFFLFCNVFRICRTKELVWAASFIISAILAMRVASVASLYFMGWNLMFAAILILSEIQKPDYHGIFWKTFNPDLEARWVEKAAKNSDTPGNN